jgi:PAS domain S-box-containing protein
MNEIEYQCKIVPLTNKNSEVINYYLFFEKIDSRITYSKIAGEFQFDYKELVDKLDLKFIIYDPKFNIIYSSENIKNGDYELFSVSNSKILYERFSFIKRELLENAEKNIFNNLSFKSEIHLLDKINNQRHFELKIYPIGDSNRILIIDDITEAFVNQKKLRNSTLILENTINNSSEMVVLLKPSGEIIFVNTLFCEKSGYDKKKLTSNSFYSLIDPEYIRKNIFDISAFTEKKSSEIDLPLINSTGEKLNLKAQFCPIKTSEGNLIIIASYLSDIEKNKAQEQQLNFFNKIIENTIDGVVLIEGSKIIKSNIAFAQMFGYETNYDFEGNSFLDIISDEDKIRVSEFLRLVEMKKQNPGKIDFIGRTANKRKIYVEMSVGVFDFNDRTILILSARNISDKVNAYREITNSEENYRTLAEHIDDCLFTYERIGFNLKPVFCTSVIRKITGYSDSVFLNDARFFLKIIYLDDYKKIKPKLVELLKSKSKKKGELIFRIVHKNGSLIWVKVKLSIQRTIGGNIQKLFGIITDITISKKTDEEIIKSVEELKKLNETKDKFISIISHDLRTPFTSILGFADLLLNDESLSNSEKKQYIKFIHESAQTMLSLVNSVLDWTRLQTGRIKFEPEKVNMSEVIRHIINSLSAVAMHKGIKIYNLIDENLILFVDKNLISLIFYNLISNAIKFTNQNGRIEISASQNSTRTFYNFSVKDNGIGIKPEDLNKLFSVDSKFTTEGTLGEKGSGLGLSLVKEMIEKHHGKIWVESQYGKGSNFQFSLPSSSAIILLVEPENTDRILYSKIIKSFKPDFAIYAETTSSESLNKIKQFDPALVIVNHTLVEMSGIEFIKEIIKLNLQRKPQIIIIGSKLDKAIIDDYNELGVEFVLNKPVNVNTLQQYIEKSLIKTFQRTHI